MMNGEGAQRKFWGVGRGWVQGQGVGSGTDGDRKLSQALSRGGWHPSFSWRRTKGIKARGEGGKGVRRGGWEKPRVRGPRRRSTGKEERQRQRTGRGRREMFLSPEAWGSARWGEGT